MKMSNEVEREVQGGRQLAQRHEPPRGAPRYRPLVDILELSDELRVIADMPGAKADDIDIEFEKGMLTIHAKVESRRPENANDLIRGYGVGDFYRAFELSENIDAERISAEYVDGVLSLRLPKTEQAKPRKIEVRAN
jgi:HSP20 family molecular chaperone IbpA